MQCEAKRRRLTYTPPVNAAIASTVETYGDDETVFRPEVWEQCYQTDDET